MTRDELTLGIEEEYLILDPETGAPTARSEQIRRLAAGSPALGADDVEPELLQVQLEVATPICTDLDEAGGHLLRLRSELSNAAERDGYVLAGMGAASRFGDALPPASDKDRYRSMHEHAPRLVDEMLLNGMHVHVGIDDPEDRIRVLNGLRGWLPTLTALAANSPFWDGADSGFASWRTVHFARWPVSGPPPVFRDAADYENRISAVLDTGALVDRGQLYWQARLSQTYATVEVRVADVQLTVDDAVLIAGVLRGLATTLLTSPAPSAGVIPDELLRTAVWQAARDELGATLLDPRTATSRPAAEVVDGLFEMIRPALEDLGDADHVDGLRAARARTGSGAARQRAAHADGGLTRVQGVAVDAFVNG